MLWFSTCIFLVSPPTQEAHTCYKPRENRKRSQNITAAAPQPAVCVQQRKLKTNAYCFGCRETVNETSPLRTGAQSSTRCLVLVDTTNRAKTPRNPARVAPSTETIFFTHEAASFLPFSRTPTPKTHDTRRTCVPSLPLDKRTIDAFHHGPRAKQARRGA